MLQWQVWRRSPTRKTTAKWPEYERAILDLSGIVLLSWLTLHRVRVGNSRSLGFALPSLESQGTIRAPPGKYLLVSIRPSHSNRFVLLDLAQSKMGDGRATAEIALGGSDQPQLFLAIHFDANLSPIGIAVISRIDGPDFQPVPLLGRDVFDKTSVTTES